MKRLFFFLAGWIITPVFALAQTAGQPNIIFILADDLGYGDLGVLFQKDRNGTQLSTPELDKMAGEGAILSRHYCPAPVCAPSRSSFISGLHQGHADVRNNQFDKAIEDNHNVANTLKTAGYRTLLVGKYGLQGDARYAGQVNGNSPAEWPGYPTNRGFDYFYGYVRHVDGHVHYPANDWPLGNNDVHRTPKEVWENDDEVSGGLDKCYTTDLFTARAKQLIVDHTESNPTQPFFMFLSYDTPHAALQLPTVEYPAGKGVNGGVQWVGDAGNMINTATGTIDSYYNPLYTGTGLTDNGMRFGTMVTRVDHGVGDVLQTLKDLNIADNTIVIFTSDNGPHSESYIQGANYTPEAFQSYGPFEGMKRDTYEGGIRVPTLAWGPTRVKAGHVTDQPSQFHDWMATFLDYSGLQRPARIDGVSLRAILEDRGTPEEGTVYVEYTVGGSMPNYGDYTNNNGTSRTQSQVIYLDGYKGIRNNVSDHSQEFKIFNTLTDLKEGTNLAGSSSEFTALQQRMQDRVLQIRMPNSSATRPYDDEPVPAVSANDPVAGVLVYTYEGSWSWVPQFSVMQELGIFSDTKFSPDLLTRSADAGLLFRGFISVPQAGDWTFYSTSDEGIIFRLHDKLVLDDDYNHDGSEVSQSVNLAQGLHPFRLYYRTAEKTPQLDIMWSGPGTGKGMIAPENLVIESGSLSLSVKNRAAPALPGRQKGIEYRPDGKRAIPESKSKRRILFPGKGFSKSSP